VNPFEFSEPIATERLTLRLMTDDDTDAVHAWMSDPEVARYQLYEPRDRTLTAEKVAEMAAKSTLGAKDDWIQPGVELAGHGVIGSIYFKITSIDDLTGEIGWAFTRAYQGKGYAVEAASAILDLAFGSLGLHRVFAELDPRNDPSVALCLRLGMRHEAHFAEHMMFKGAWADTGMYGILDREWSARRASAG
jgi:RimJ/RimL family protein N-acetyltransferase